MKCPICQSELSPSKETERGDLYVAEDCSSSTEFYAGLITPFHCINNHDVFLLTEQINK